VRQDVGHWICTVVDWSVRKYPLGVGSGMSGTFFESCASGMMNLYCIREPLFALVFSTLIIVGFYYLMKRHDERIRRKLREKYDE